MKRRKHVYTIRKAAELLGIGTTQFSRWRTRGLIAEYPDGNLDVETTWTNANRALDLTRGGKPDRGYGGRPCAPVTAPDSDAEPDTIAEILPSDPDEIRALKMAEAREKVRKLRLQNEVLEKSLIPRDMVCEIFADGMAAVRSALTSWPVRWRHKFVGLQPDEIERIIRGEVNAILKELSDALAADKLDPDK